MKKLSDNHYPQLDGLRALAILLVLIYHFLDTPKVEVAVPILQKIATSLFVGVDLFFVLSGFLITGILIDAKGNHNFFRNFYMRRLLRIFPIYYLFVAFNYLMSNFNPELFWGLDKISSWVFCLYIQNYVMPFTGISGGVLSHLWSLAIEEQFYLLWPLLIYYIPNKRLPLLFLSIIVISLGLRFGTMGIPNGWQISFYFLFTRMDALAFGAFIAYGVRSDFFTTGRQKLFTILFAFSVMFLLFEITYYGYLSRHRLGYPMLYTCLNIFFSYILWQSLKKQWLINMMSKKFLMSIGKYSYAIYLYHLVIADVFQRMPNNYLYIMSLVPFVLICYGMAWLSWKFIESPILNFKKYYPR